MNGCWGGQRKYLYLFMYMCIGYATLQLWTCVKRPILCPNAAIKTHEQLYLPLSLVLPTIASQACTIGSFDSEPVKQATLGDLAVGTARHVESGDVALAQGFRSIQRSNCLTYFISIKKVDPYYRYHSVANTYKTHIKICLCYHPCFHRLQGPFSWRKLMLFECIY